MLVPIKKIWGEHLGLVDLCYNSVMHSVTKMFLFELALGKEAKEPMELTIHVGQRYHSKKMMKMVKGHEKIYA